MIDRQHGKFLAQCDHCDEVLDTGTGDVGEARETMLREGWFFGRIGREVLHGCPQCGEPQ